MFDVGSLDVPHAYVTIETHLGGSAPEQSEICGLGPEVDLLLGDEVVNAWVYIQGTSSTAASNESIFNTWCVYVVGVHLGVSQYEEMDHLASSAANDWVEHTGRLTSIVCGKGHMFGPIYIYIHVCRTKYTKF